MFCGGGIIISNLQVAFNSCCPPAVPQTLFPQGWFLYTRPGLSTFHLSGLETVKLPRFRGEKYTPEVCKPHWKKMGLILAQCAEGRSRGYGPGFPGIK